MGWGKAVLKAAGQEAKAVGKTVGKPVGTETLGRGLGIIEKAVIEIEDARKREIEIIEGTGGRNKHTVKYTNKSYEFKDSGTLDMIDVATKMKMESDLNRLKTTTKRYIVRFNPNTLSLNSYGGGQVAKTDMAANGQAETKFQSMEANIILNVQLIIDDMSPEDCFVNEMTDIKGLAKKVVKKIAKYENSVQKQVEGLIAALKNKNTRRIRFVWGNFSYYGILTNINAQYTMFSKHGIPVRAILNLSISCADQDISFQNRGQWQESFENAFAKSDVTSLQTASQKVGNLVNFNL